MTKQPPLHRRLRDAYQTSELQFGKRWLPLDTLDQEITESSIKTEARLGYFFCFRNPSFPNQVVQRAKKVFAILSVIGEPQAIKSLYEEGLTDEDLPLRHSTDLDVVMSRDGRRQYKTFTAWADDRRVAEFVDKQWIMLAPILDTSGIHLKLDVHIALPFIYAQQIGGGPTSMIYRCEVHPAHQRGLPMTSNKCLVALKEFRNPKPFRQEVDIYDKIQQLNIRHPNLITRLATWDQERSYFAVFPWADGGNLNDYWTRNDTAERHAVKRTEHLVSWSLEQMLGIAGALNCLHSINCRHGDLKPENILHFTEGNGGRGNLVLCDVGSARIHKRATMTRNQDTSSRATTPSYEAPETFDLETRSRRYDIWSLGCIFLEFTIWILEDCDAIGRFHRARDPPHFEFYLHYLRQSPVKKNEVHPVVLAAVDSIKRDVRVKGGTALEDLVNLIWEHMLVVDVESRDTADRVVERLRKIAEFAQQHPDYLLNDVGSVPDKLDFQPQWSSKGQAILVPQQDINSREPDQSASDAIIKSRSKFKTRNQAIPQKLTIRKSSF